MGYTNSPLVSYTKISPNKTVSRNHKIDTITIHCVVGQLTVESLGNVFANSARKASSNYGIGKDGRIGMYVEEKDRSFCSSNASNDHRAVTIEVASDTTHPYRVNDVALKSLINLCADICKRNNIKELKWLGDPKLIGQVDKQNMTVHRWFAKKACPGDYLYNLHGHIANEVNKKLGVSNNVISQSPITTSVPNTNYVYNGIDYSLVFNPTYYVNKYSDLKKVFGIDSKKLFDHFIQYGMKEGRQASENFNVTIYKSKNEDLKKSFGNDLSKYYKHYIQFGHAEKRKSV